MADRPVSADIPARVRVTQLRRELDVISSFTLSCGTRWFVVGRPTRERFAEFYDGSRRAFSEHEVTW